jgi:Ca-activated chloride channel homolog
MKFAQKDAPRGNRSDELSSPCIEVTIRWGVSVLHVAHLDPPRSFYVGERVDGAGPASDCFLPASVIGAEQAPLFLVNNGAVQIVLLPDAEGTVEIAGQPARTVGELLEAGAALPCDGMAGASVLDFPPGSKAEIEVHGVLFSVASVNAGRAIAGHYHIDRKGLPFVTGSAILHVGLLAACAYFMPPLSADDEESASAEQIYMMQAALEEIAEKEQAELETEQVAEATADTKEGGTGTRAKGEEGSAGRMGKLAQRYGVQGPADPQIDHHMALRDAAEFGMIGLLNSGAGGDPNAPTAPWGRDDSLGSAYGAGGLGLSGLGNGGGGTGIGAIGTIGHGAGSGSGQGFGAGHGRLGGSAGAGSRGAAPPPVVPIEPARVEAPIDPNGRFATTYRPGAGHLAAFESAVARGIVPAAAREVVSDVGARYTPTLSVPEGRALAFRADLERSSLSPSGGAFHVRLAMQSSSGAAESRPHLSVHLVLDVSGSMAGESIERAKSAAAALVDKLAPTDDFSLVTFSTGADVLVKDGPVGPRRASIKQVIQGITDQGGTNIGEGLRLGYAQAGLASIPEDAVRVVLLLSDGRPNSGITGGEQLSRLALDAFQRGIQTSAFGLGSDYDGSLMSSIANDGAGGYYYLRDPDQIAPALSTELDKRLDPVATAVEVRVRLKKDVDLLRVYGSQRLSEAEAARVRVREVAADAQAQKRDHIQRDRQEDNEGGMRFFIPAFARGDSHALLLKLQVPAGVGSRAIAGVELKYKDRIAKTNVVEEIPIKIAFADSDAQSASSIDPSVARTVQGFAAGETLTDAAARIARGDHQSAVALLAEREQILQQAAATLHEPLFQRDAARLARLRAQAGNERGAGDPLVLAMMLETAGRVHLR